MPFSCRTGSPGSRWHLCRRQPEHNFRPTSPDPPCGTIIYWQFLNRHQPFSHAAGFFHFKQSTTDIRKDFLLFKSATRFIFSYCIHRQQVLICFCKDTQYLVSRKISDRQPQRHESLERLILHFGQITLPLQL